MIKQGLMKYQRSSMICCLDATIAIAELGYEVTACGFPAEISSLNSRISKRMTFEIPDRASVPQSSFKDSSIQFK